MKKYRITLTEEQLRLMCDAVEDWHRFLAGQCEMSNATSYIHDTHAAREALQTHVRPYIVPELPHPNSSYGWSGGNCPNEHQRKAIAMSYMLYREPVHFQTVNAEQKMDWNVYNGYTIMSERRAEVLEAYNKSHGMRVILNNYVDNAFAYDDYTDLRRRDFKILDFKYRQLGQKGGAA